MIDYFKFRWKLWKLARVWDGIDAANRERLKEAKAMNLGRDELKSMEDAAAFDYFDHQDNVRAAHSRYLVSQASAMIIPLPDDNDKKMWETDLGRTFLTKEGINVVRAAVRAERKARLEMFLMWVPGVVGILGTLIGLASILLKK